MQDNSMSESVGKQLIKSISDDRQADLLGKVTASNLEAVMAKGYRGQPSASRANYMSQLLVQRLSGKSKGEAFLSDAVQWGIEKEPLARAAYQVASSEIVRDGKFVDHPTIKMTGAAPDGFVGKHGLIEIKCPNTATHLEFVDTRKIPWRYMLQMQWQMECTDREWCDYISFDPRLPKGLQLEVMRVERNELLIYRIEEAVVGFLYELERKEDRYRRRLA